MNADRKCLENTLEDDSDFGHNTEEKFREFRDPEKRHLEAEQEDSSGESESDEESGQESNSSEEESGKDEEGDPEQNTGVASGKNTEICVVKKS